MLSTYATWVIREVSIADQAPTIPILVHMIETINNIMCRSRQVFNEIGREADGRGTCPEARRKTLCRWKLRLAMRRTFGDLIEDNNAIFARFASAVKTWAPP